MRCAWAIVITRWPVPTETDTNRGSLNTFTATASPSCAEIDAIIGAMTGGVVIVLAMLR